MSLVSTIDQVLSLKGPVIFNTGGWAGVSRGGGTKILPRGVGQNLFQESTKRSIYSDISEGDTKKSN